MLEAKERVAGNPEDLFGFHAILSEGHLSLCWGRSHTRSWEECAHLSGMAEHTVNLFASLLGCQFSCLQFSLVSGEHVLPRVMNMATSR